MRQSKAIMLLQLMTVASLCTFSSAYAVITNHSGTLCGHYYGSDADKIDYLPSGARSYSPNATWITCPLRRNTSNSNGSNVYVDIQHAGSQTTSCTAYSQSYAGDQLASSSLSWTGAGFHEFAFDLVGPGKSNTWSDYAVVCVIPGYSAAKIIGIDLDER